jgi:hypothetical protein
MGFHFEARSHCKGTISDCAGQQEVALRTAAVDDQETRPIILQHSMQLGKALSEPRKECAAWHPVVMLTIVDADIVGRRSDDHVDRFRRHDALKVEAIVQYDDPALMLHRTS